MGQGGRNEGGEVRAELGGMEEEFVSKVAQATQMIKSEGDEGKPVGVYRADEGFPGGIVAVDPLELAQDSFQMDLWK